MSQYVVQTRSEFHATRLLDGAIAQDTEFILRCPPERMADSEGVVGTVTLEFLRGQPMPMFRLYAKYRITIEEIS